MNVLESLILHLIWKGWREKEKETKGQDWSYKTVDVIYVLRLLTDGNEIGIKKKSESINLKAQIKQYLVQEKGWVKTTPK